MIEGVAGALLTFANPQILLMLVAGVLVGAVFSAIPGLTSTLALALILPFTFAIEATAAFVFMIGLFGGGLYGGMLTAIALNIPGAPGSVATTFDGYPLYLKGQGGKAIGIATLSSVIGGMGSAIILTLAAVQLARIALRFGPPETFALTVFGMIAVVSICQDTVKGALCGLFGVFLGIMGVDLFGTFRFNFGMRELISGTPLLPTVVGMFAMVKVFQSINDTGKELKTGSLPKGASPSIARMQFPTPGEMKRLLGTFIRGTLIGTFIGFLPGAGGNIAAFTAYNVEKRISKTPDEFGRGSLEGLASAETANNAVPGGSLIPTITLGIPGDQFTAVLLGAFLIHGLPIGPLLFRDHQDVIYIIFLSTFLMNLVFIPIGFFASRPIVRVAATRNSILIPIIAAFSLTGMYAIATTVTNMGIGVFFGVVALFMHRYDYPVAPVILGLILSTLIEDSLVQSLIMSGGSVMIFVTRPISLLFVALSVLFAILPMLRRQGKQATNEMKQ